MLFHFLNFSQGVVCMFGHKKIYKDLQISKSTPKGDILFKKMDYSVVFRCLWCHKAAIRISLKLNAPKEIRMVGGWGERLETRCGCFYITVFLKETDCLQKILDVIFISSCM